MPDSSEHEHPIQDYLAGRLSETEASALEERSLTDEDLATELALALDIRAAAEGTEAASGEPTEGRYAQRSWAWPAAAAAVLVLALGAGLLVTVDRGGPDEPLRGAETVLELELSRSASSVTVSWPMIEGAAGGYRIELFRLDGSLVAAGETMDRELTIAVPDDAAAEPLYVRGEAFGPLRDVIAESSLEAVPDG